ncbi:MAG: hypothetical protein CMQ43_10345 [Gammaproteobacteria bacterium]|nr:hypothetical protein [Gammaproteobacteria bacterium]
MSAFRPRDVSMFRPYPDEVPWELLTEPPPAGAGLDDAAVAACLDANFVRVAKHADRVVGAYALRPVTATRFELVALVVEPGHRRQGLGRWLAGHAIGLAETKGGREVVARPADAAARRFLAGLDFQPDGDALLLTLTPE